MAKDYAWTTEQVKTFRGLCQIMCDRWEVAAVMDLEPADIDKYVAANLADELGKGATFDAAAKAYGAKGRATLRKKQFDMAMGGDRSMLQWLGKNYLGQSDRPPERIDLTDDDDPILDMQGESSARKATTDKKRRAKVPHDQA